MNEHKSGVDIAFEAVRYTRGLTGPGRVVDPADDAAGHR